MRKVLRVVYFAAGTACIVYFFVLWRASRFGLSMSWMWPGAGAALWIAGGLCGLRSLPGWLRIAWRACLAAGLVLLMVLEGCVISGMRAQAPADLDYLIVLGARVEEDGPSPALNRRLNAVMACLDEHPRATIIASGGQGPDEPMSEAECIRRELERRGVDPSRILVEDRSTTTAENLRFSMALMDSPDARVGIVTNNYHVWRALRLARHVGLSDAHGIAAKYTGHTLFHFMVREAVCTVVERLRGNL